MARRRALAIGASALVAGGVAAIWVVTRPGPLAEDSAPTPTAVASAGAESSPQIAASHEAQKAAYLASLRTEAQIRSGVTPNVLLINFDDLGYGDLGFTGDGPIQTPHIDALAAEGVVFSQFYAPSPVCSPSRAALLTGRLGPRVGVSDVLFPSDSSNPGPAIEPDEITMAEVMEAVGYDTAMVGKWHVGDTPGSLPNDLGFASFVGSLYSHDMTPFEINRDDEVLVQAPVDLTQLDALYTDEAVDVIEDAGASDAPFFLYVAPNFPHEPLAVAPDNAGISAAGLYGDVVQALDDGIGRMVDALEATGQRDNTIIVVTSDNGPWHLGDPGHQRGRKGSVSGGGQRVPFLIQWPAGIEGGRTVDAMAMGTDLLPTVLDWLDLPAPSDRVLDGTSLAAVAAGTGDKVGDAYYFYSSGQLLAVSDGRYKYYPEQPYLQPVSGQTSANLTREGPWLFDLATDPSESYDVLAREPDVGAHLAALLAERDDEMSANPRGWR